MANIEDRCSCCNQNITEDFIFHRRSTKHVFNFYIWAYKNYRKALSNLPGIVLTIAPNDGITFCGPEKKGVSTLNISPVALMQRNNTIEFTCSVKNERKSPITIHSVVILDDNNLSTVTDTKSQLLKPLQSKRTFNGIRIKFALRELIFGSFKLPVLLNFTTNGKTTFESMWRLIVVKIDDGYREDEVVLERSPFTNQVWRVLKTLPPNSNAYQDVFPIPKQYEKYFLTAFKEWPNITEVEYHELYMLRQAMFPGYPTKEKYKTFFHYCLWLEEAAQMIMVDKYNMENVKLQTSSNLLKLRVPGLAEKRPSLIPGDVISIRVHDDEIAYQGIVRIVEDMHILIKDVNSELREIVLDGEDSYDVCFHLGRLPLDRAHAGLEAVASSQLINLLFPEESNVIVPTCYSIPNNGFHNPNVARNVEQRRAVENILNCTSYQAPYIVYGPPGTGKTVTIVEAIYQILRQTDENVLVCAPANAACDMLTQRLMSFCKKNELIRLHAQTRDISTIPKALFPYSNIDSENHIQRYHFDKISKYRVVVTTLVLIGGYHFHAKKSKYSPGYVFIDEAAQASEPDSCIAISFMGDCSQLVLAGDPQQLGPVVMSHVARTYHLDKSLLHRLTETNPLYDVTHENPLYITMLKKNYRSHPLILEIPNRLFYHGLLEACSTGSKNDPISTVAVYPKIQTFNNELRQFRDQNQNTNQVGCAIEFCAISSKERREGRSPSYFNPAEASMVVEYIKTMLKLNVKNKVIASHIGVVTPYARQLYRIKNALQSSKLGDVEVGTTETFQGREKRIIIMSTVRAQHNLLKHDKKYNLGFVNQKERFNVAVTRAMSKLVVIGCPMVLGTDRKFLDLIELCEQNGSYYGAPYERRTEAKMQKINSNFQSVRYR